ncbi:MAG: hypothetical protein EOM64_08575 [Erysipelotrichia bacterium]|nr:hypothetical protein [Erysipelotrichia bacterium]
MHSFYRKSHGFTAYNSSDQNVYLINEQRICSVVIDVIVEIIFDASATILQILRINRFQREAAVLNGAAIAKGCMQYFRNLRIVWLWNLMQAILAADGTARIIRTVLRKKENGMN